MIALRIFTLYFASFPCWLLPTFRRGEWRTQRFSRLFSGRKRRALLLNQDWCAGLNQFEKFNEIGIPHPNAAVTCRFADFMFVVRPVNVNEAVARVRVVRFESIVRRMFILKTDRFATFENGADGRVASKFFGNPKLAQRRFHAAFLRTEAEARRGNGISAYRLLAGFQRESLIANGNVKASGLHRDVWTLHFACE
jgi:hypothetical protein